MKSKQKIWLGMLVSIISIAVLFVVKSLFGSQAVDVLGFGFLIGLSYAALCK
ncbi:hypothetical protein [Tumebacillus lipolyticus]|uniref:Uncharacterized protein n=1 Tax=Tumebacillus lipolyticus TaxID=1280370 RepID=A0ABW4ZT37_9BACL